MEEALLEEADEPKEGVVIEVFVASRGKIRDSYSVCRSEGGGRGNGCQERQHASDLFVAITYVSVSRPYIPYKIFRGQLISWPG